jgi:hypothetical protein
MNVYKSLEGWQKKPDRPGVWGGAISCAYAQVAMR